MKKVIYRTEVVVHAYEVGANNEKIENTKKLENTDEWDELHIFADEGKVFRRISTGEVLTNHIGVGSNDDPNDFEEIEAKKDNQ